jgi:hypothetical protein
MCCQEEHQYSKPLVDNTGILLVEHAFNEEAMINNVSTESLALVQKICSTWYSDGNCIPLDYCALKYDEGQQFIYKTEYSDFKINCISIWTDNLLLLRSSVFKPYNQYSILYLLWRVACLIPRTPKVFSENIAIYLANGKSPLTRVEMPFDIHGNYNDFLSGFYISIIPTVAFFYPIPFHISRMREQTSPSSFRLARTTYLIWTKSQSEF